MFARSNALVGVTTLKGPYSCRSFSTIPNTLRISRTPYQLGKSLTKSGPNQTTTLGHRQRSISSYGTQPKFEFLVQIPDFPNTSEKRERAKERHNREIQPMVDSGDLTLGSAILRGVLKEGEKPSIIGSVVIYKAKDEAEVRKLLEEDAYTKEGAWDAKNAQIWPILTGIRTAL